MLMCSTVGLINYIFVWFLVLVQNLDTHIQIGLQVIIGEAIRTERSNQKSKSVVGNTNYSDVKQRSRTKSVTYRKENCRTNSNSEQKPPYKALNKFSFR